MLYPNDNYFEKYDDIWYIHPLFKFYACSGNGHVIHKRTKILKPKLIKNELYIKISLLRWYPLKNFVFECMHDIQEVPLVEHIDGNILNNSIGNLALLHIRSL